MAQRANTFREKVIRVAASAAVCGLSASFIAGEIIASGSGPQIRWAPLSAVLPESFPVVEPAKEFALAMERFEIAPESTVVALATPASDIVTISQIMLAEAKLPPPVEDAAPAPEIRAEIQKVHEAAAKVAKATVIDKVSVKAAAPEDAAVVEQKVEVRDEIAGRLILGSGEMEPGHFEIGLFEQVDAKGAPVGFPLVQQILKKGQQEFSIKRPRLDKPAYLFAQFFPDDVNGKEEFFGFSGNPINPDAQVAKSHDLYISGGKKTVAKVPGVVVRGKVTAMFAKGGEAKMSDAVVRLRGTNHSATTNSSGEFELKIPGYKGTALLEVIKSGFFPSIVELAGDQREIERPIEIVSRDAIDQMATSLGIRQQRTKGIFLLSGPAQSTYQMSLKAEGPYYYSADAHPMAGLKQTSSDGRAIYFNVEPGVGTVEATVRGDVLAPAAMSVVEGGGLTAQRVVAVDGKVKGRVYNPVAGAGGMKAMAGLRVRVEGSTEWAVTDSTGAFELPQIRWLKDSTVMIEVSSDKIYHHRYLVRLGQTKQSDLSLFVFPQDYISRLANSVEIPLDAYNGMILGGVGKGSALRMDGLADHSEVNNSRDFYFDEKGMLRGGAARTNPAFGTFVVFNVPRGRTLLQGLDASGAMKYSAVTYASPSVVTVVLE